MVGFRGPGSPYRVELALLAEKELSESARAQVALLNQQMRALRELRELREGRGGPPDTTLEESLHRLVRLTVNGVAAGLQNTG